MYQRIRAARKYAKMTQEKLAKLCTVTRNAVTQWESENPETRSNPPLVQIKRVCLVTGAPLSWMLSDGSNIEGGWDDFIEPTNDDRGLPVGKYEYIKHYDVQFSAGNGSNGGEYEELKQDMAFKSTWLKQYGLIAENLVVVPVVGESMMPRLHDTDEVLIDISKKEIKSNKTYAIRYANDLRIKRLDLRYDGSLIIKSDNSSPEYSDEVIPPEHIDDIEVIGRVVRLVSGGGF